MNNISHLRKAIVRCFTFLRQQPCVLCSTQSQAPCCPECWGEFSCTSISTPDLTILFDFDYPLNHLLHQMKYHGDLGLAHWLGQLLAQRLTHVHEHTPFNGIIAMPLHPLRLRQRGFNQAQELARPVARQLQIPLLTHNCHRRHHLQAQVELPMRARSQLPENLFDCQLDLAGQHILLIDDVCTTGSTLKRLAEAVRSQGATVHSAVIAQPKL